MNNENSELKKLVDVTGLLNTETEESECYQTLKDYFNGFSHYREFLAMQSTYYPSGVSFDAFVQNIQDHAVTTAIAGLRNKMGQNAIEDITTDDGTTYYRLG